MCGTWKTACAVLLSSDEQQTASARRAPGNAGRRLFFGGRGGLRACRPHARKQRVSLSHSGRCAASALGREAIPVPAPDSALRAGRAWLRDAWFSTCSAFSKCSESTDGRERSRSEFQESFIV
uniref:Uncharacterized protein n=1 Tax=Rousettus aegyptiacus TaxID=9407 RepID=A0A7J8BA94_ROUAE|nr:hypothetical protein HJG63_009956 [Rousettus aegyptiacus]